VKLLLARAFPARAICAVLLFAAPAVLPRIARAQQTEPPAAAATPPPATQPEATQNPHAPTPPPETPAIRVSTGLVHLVATVTDHKHVFVTDLDRNDFKVLENGTPQEIQFFGRQTDLPLRIALLLDTSNSIRPRLEFEKDAAIDFLTSVIRRNKDLAFLMTFDNEPQIIQDYTDNLSLLTSAIREQRAGGGTALQDAICLASEKLTHLPTTKGQPTDVRRVVVVISDGEDNLSDRALSDAIDASIRSEAAVFTISTNTDWLAIDNPDKPNKYHTGRGDKVLQQFADQTGGRAFFPYSTNDLAVSFTDIGTELRSQYYIAYSPSMPPNGQYRKIEMQIDRKGLVVRVRKGYYAVAPSSSTTISR
jgi:VWFA-related protein